jgi:DNA repair protein RadC
MNPSTWSRTELVENLLGLGTCTPPCYTGEAIAIDEAGNAQRLRQMLAIARELLLRDLHRDLEGQHFINNPNQLREWLRLRLAGLEHEEFLVVFLDAHHRILGIECMFRGTVTQTSVYPREVVKAALAYNCSAVALVHNHPTGNPAPSRSDECLTTVLKNALALVDVRCIDHLIVAGDEILSMASRGLV